MANPKGQKETASERRLKALRLRQGGYSFGEIAQALSISRAQAQRDCDSVLQQWGIESQAEAQAQRQLEDSRLDELLKAWWPRAKAGDSEATGKVLRILERRAKYWGLDQPAKLLLREDGTDITIRVKYADSD